MWGPISTILVTSLSPDPGVLDAEGLRKALLRAEEYLEINHGILDNLNVFPVPDGDTGINMLTTFRAGVRLLRPSPLSSLAAISDSMTNEILHGSRGNSGFIIACFFHGFFDTAKRYDILTKERLTECFVTGYYHVNKSLFSPVEGTVITIMRAMIEAMKVSAALSIADHIRTALSAGKVSLLQTPRILKVLGRAGVVDSGALGFIFLVEGLLRGILEEPAAAEEEQEYRFPPEDSGDPEEQKKTYRYCTEVLITPEASADSETLRLFLLEQGDSIAVVHEERRMKVHIHTDFPESILERLKEHGVIEHVKIDDIHEQIALLSDSASAETAPSVLACVPGPGFTEIFASLGVEHTLVYGKDLPAAGEILSAVSAVQAGEIILLPNNKNILPAAMLAKEKSDKSLSILPTRTVIQGITASYGYSGNEGLARNIASMKESIGLSEGFSVFRSVSDSVYGGTSLKLDEYFAVREEEILAAEMDPSAVIVQALLKLGTEGMCNVTCYCREQPRRDVAEGILSALEALDVNLSVEFLFGGQYREDFIVSIE